MCGIKHSGAVIGSTTLRKTTSNWKLILGANNSTFFHKFMSFNLKQHLQLISMDSSTDLPFTYNNNTWTLHTTSRRSYTIKIYSSVYEKKIFALSITFDRWGLLDYCETQNNWPSELKRDNKNLAENII